VISIVFRKLHISDTMQGAYNIDSDDDDEEELPTNVPKSASPHIQELEKV
jgi:hypothetical protein